MASGTAVLCSDIPPLRETCGEGAEYFDPHNPGQLARLLTRFATDDAARAALAARGAAHVHTRQQRISASAGADAIVAALASEGPR